MGTQKLAICYSETENAQMSILTIFLFNEPSNKNFFIKSYSIHLKQNFE